MKLEEIIVKRWEDSSKGYGEIVEKELMFQEAKEWSKYLSEYLPEKKDANILDVGCGPGFFAAILGSQGYHVTGVDISKGMVKEAKERVEKLGIDADFKVMDSHKLNFSDESFDVIISRNVIWTLYDPKGAYKEWIRCLKPGGKLLAFDANWMLPYYDKSLFEQKKKDEAEYMLKYGEPQDSCQDSGLMSQLDREAVLAEEIRPEWDRKVLEDLGLKVKTDEEAYKELWDTKRKLRYRTSPLFSIIGEKI